MRLIDADALLAKYPTHQALRQKVEAEPTVGIRAVAKWQKSKYNGYLECSNCHGCYVEENWLVKNKWNYCPNCGAEIQLTCR